MYIPKNKIITNLFSNNELVYKKNNKPYTGFYYKIHTGQLFTGKDQNDGLNQELTIDNQEEEPPEETLELVQNPMSSNLFNYNYARLKGINVNNSKTQIFNLNPKPTEKEYEVGVFMRYFIVKINEDIYKEITKKIYTDIKTRNKKYEWELYNTFKMHWDLTGDKEETKKINKNMTELTSSRIKREGFGDFLNHNYTKFHKD